MGALFRGHKKTYRLYREAKTKTLNISAIFVLAVGSIVPAFLANTTNALANTITPADPQGWQAVDDNGHGGSLSFVAGPTDHSGSAQLSINASDQGYMLAKPGAYAGTKLSDITTLSYSTYVQSGNSTIAPSIQLNITSDVNSPASWQGRLVYEPYMNGTVVDDTWQDWNARAGKWWLSRPNSFGNICGQGTPCTFAELIAAYPNIGINTGPLAGVGFKAGSGWAQFVGNIDNFTFNDDFYDFEPVTAPAAPSNLRWVVAGNSLACGSATNAPLAAPTWDAVAGATSYEYQFMPPGAGTWSDGGTYANPTTGPTAFGTTEGVEGTWQFRVRATSPSGASEWSQSCAVTFDKTAPASISGLTLRNASGAIIPHTGYTTSYSVTASWDAANGADRYEYAYWNNITSSPYHDVVSGWKTIVNDTQLGGVFNQGEGTHYVAVRAVDNAGNTSPWTPAYQVTYDATGPQIAIVSVNGNSGANPTVNIYSNNGKLTFRGTFTDSIAANYVEMQLVDAGGNSRALVTTHKSLMIDDILAEFDATSLADGTYTILARAVDGAGNRTDASKTFTLDNTVPAPTVIGQNFNTHDSDDYSGINVGFRISDFRDVSNVTVALRAGDSTLVTNTGNSNLLSLINEGATTELSTPFITIPGTYTEQYWDLGTYTWDSSSPMPTSALVTITGTDASGTVRTASATLSPLSEGAPSWPTFASIMPAQPAAGQNPQNEGTGAGNVQGAVDTAVQRPTTAARISGALSRVQGLGTYQGAAVLGADTSTESQTVTSAPQVLAAESGDTKEVVQFENANHKENHDGFNWWWLAAAAAILGALWWILAGRRRSQDKDN